MVTVMIPPVMLTMSSSSGDGLIRMSKVSFVLQDVVIEKNNVETLLVVARRVLARYKRDVHLKL